jgi:hypothetical protein
MVGDEPVTTPAERKNSNGTLRLLSPTDCVKDRLAAFFHWNDRQALEQALVVALRHQIELGDIKRWSTSEGASEKHRIFTRELKKRRCATR